MTTQHDTDPYSEIARLDAEINRCVFAHDTPGAMNALTARRKLEAAVKAGVAVGVTVLALAATAVADAKVNWLAKAQTAAAASFKAETSLIAGLQVVVKCSGKPAAITCDGMGYDGPSIWRGQARYTVRHGKLVVTTAAHQVMATTMARTATASLPTLENREAMATAVLAAETGAIVAYQGYPVTAANIHAETPSVPVHAHGIYAWLIRAQGIVASDGATSEVSVAVVSGTGYVFNLTTYVGPSGTFRSPVGQWVGPHGARGTWTKVGGTFLHGGTFIMRAA